MRLLEHHSSPNCISILESADRQRGCASLKPLVQRASQHVLWGAALRHPPSGGRWQEGRQTTFVSVAKATACE